MTGDPPHQPREVGTPFRAERPANATLQALGFEDHAPQQSTPRRVDHVDTPTALYARVSTRDQDGSSQIARLREWAQREDRRVVLERTDTATGRNVRRSGMEELMQEARGHHIKSIAVAKLDRWARSLMHLNSSLQELQQLRVEWIAVEQGIRISPDGSDATSRLNLHVLGAVAEWEASIISERTKESLAYKRSQGVRLGRPPGSKDRTPRSNKGYRARYAAERAQKEGGWQ